MRPSAVRVAVEGVTEIVVGTGAGGGGGPGGGRITPGLSPPPHAAARTRAGTSRTCRLRDLFFIKSVLSDSRPETADRAGGLFGRTRREAHLQLTQPFIQARRSGVVAWLALLLNGCSIALLQRPAAGDGPLRAGSCETSRYLPGLDAIGAATSVALLIFVPYEGSSSANAPLASRYGSAAGTVDVTDVLIEFSKRDRILVGVTSAAYIGSAVLGFNAVAECRRRVFSAEEVAAYVRTVGPRRPDAAPDISP